MLLTCMTLLSLVTVVGSSALFSQESQCHGEKFTFPRLSSPPLFRKKMYFTPSEGGSKRLVMDEGVILDPRISNSTNEVYIANLTKSDAGTFSVADSFYSGMSIKVLKLVVEDCDNPVNQFYGETYYGTVPRQTEYVEYSLRLNNPVVLWNRLDPQTNQGGRREVRRGYLKISSITQEDNGYYDFWGKDRKLLSRILLTVEGRYVKHKKFAGEQIIMGYPSPNPAWTVSFAPERGRKTIILVSAGSLVTESNPDAEQFIGRVHPLHDGVKFTLLETSDSGTYEFKDEQNNIGLTVVLEVKSAPPSMLVIGLFIAGAIVTLVICFCCVRRCCRKKSSSDRGQVRLVYHHQDQSQTSAPSYSVARAPAQSHQPVNPGVSRETAATSSEPPTYSTGMNPLLPKFSPLGAQGDTSAPTFSSDFLSSDPGPRFELKGLNTPFTHPLSSDSTVNDVYSSDKLNFLGAL